MPVEIDADVLRKIKKPTEAEIHAIIHMITDTFDEMVHNLGIVQVALLIPNLSEDKKNSLSSKIGTNIKDYRDISTNLKVLFVGYCLENEAKKNGGLEELINLLKLSSMDLDNKKVM